MAEAISLTLSTVISNAPASGSVLRGLPPQSNNLSGGINRKRTKPLDPSFDRPFESVHAGHGQIMSAWT